MSCKLNTIAIAYSIAQAAAAGSTTYFSFSDLITDNEYKIKASASLAGLFIVLEFINAWNFQGQSIRRSEEAENEHQATHNTEHSRTELTKQLTYLLFDSIKTFSNRYFLLTSLNNSGILPLEGTVFWVVLLADFIIKKPFDLTHETYEATQSFLGEHAETRRPFYHNKIECIQRSCFFEPFIITGSIEHTLGEAVIPLLLTLYENNSNLKKAFGSPLTAIASTIATLICIGIVGQTYLFEGKHTKENLRGDGKPEAISVCCKDPCQKFLNVMAPAHGLEAGVGIYFSFISAIKNNQLNQNEKDLYWTLLLVSAITCGLATAIGTYYSEVLEAQRALEEGHKKFNQDIDLEQHLLYP